ncbi:hypothetical protein [Halovivax gelatinilyticus]|uniref:hypothetical protein n=1 Tax=Halovivax gelatinilyticus TaxID=2961597 RepID=UPI0020CA2AD5|nr:hypothetical protein [Halovivax gelatinilyticus]
MSQETVEPDADGTAHEYDEAAVDSESLISTDRGKGYIKAVAGIYAAAGVAIGLLVIVVSTTGNPVTPTEEIPQYGDATATMTSTWAMMSTPFLAAVLGVGIGQTLSRSVDEATEEVAKLAGAATAAGTVALVVLGVFLAETEFQNELLFLDTSLDFGNLLTGAIGAAVVVGILSAVTVYADRELTE